MLSLQDYMSYFSWAAVFVLSYISKLVSCYQYFVNCYQTCTVEVWGPRRYYSSRDGHETSYESHQDRLYLRLLDYLVSSTSHFFTTNTPESQCHFTADNYFKHKDGTSCPTLTNAQKPISYGPQNDYPHEIQYKGEQLTIERTQIPEFFEDGYSFEKIKISSQRSNKSLIYELLNTALKYSGDSDKSGKVQIHKPKETTCWCCVEQWEEMGSPRSGRPLNSVILAEGVKEKLVNDLKDFLNSRDWYEQREISYTRGYLLYGPPGSGKSSLIKAIASEFQLDICLLTLTSSDLNDINLARILNCTPERSLILIEDIDTAFKSREDEFAEGHEQNLCFGGALCSSKVSFSGLLNALDGVMVGGSAEGRIIFMTTNHIELLDPALLRPGRIDLKLCLDYPNDSQIRRLYHRFYMKIETETSSDYAKDEDDDAEYFAKCVQSCCGDVKVTMAMVQGLLLLIHFGGHGNNKFEWSKIARKYFKEQDCHSQHWNQWGLYV